MTEAHRFDTGSGWHPALLGDNQVALFSAPTLHSDARKALQADSPRQGTEWWAREEYSDSTSSAAPAGRTSKDAQQTFEIPHGRFALGSEAGLVKHKTTSIPAHFRPARRTLRNTPL